MIFSEAEMLEFEQIVQESAEKAERGVKPSISSILMSLQFGVVLPTDDADTMWYHDPFVRGLMVMSVQTLMNEHQPSEFSVPEKAFMFAILQMGKVMAEQEK
jgi:hypothetical protein